jgi:hypothetical protein
MSQRAYIGLTDEYEWAVFFGDGTEDEPIILAVGQPFVPGRAIREAVESLEVWAAENGYQLAPPDFCTQSWSLFDLIEPEIISDVMGIQE